MSQAADRARAFVSLGGNLGDRAAELGRAREAIIGIDGVRLVACSAVVETEPVDVVDQPRFLNQVLGLTTSRSPRQVLDACLAIERDLGRVRDPERRGGPRTIDLDLLLYDDRRVAEPGLVVPHPRLGRRPFLLALCRQAGAPEAWLPQAGEAGPAS